MYYVHIYFSLDTIDTNCSAWVSKMWSLDDRSQIKAHYLQTYFACFSQQYLHSEYSSSYISITLTSFTYVDYTYEFTDYSVPSFAESRHYIGRARESYKRGFKACQEIVIEFLVEIECSTFDDSVCSRLVQKMQAKACELPDDIST